MAQDHEDEDYDDLDGRDSDFHRNVGDGQHGIDPVEEAKRPRQRRGMFIALAGAGTIAAIILAVTMRGSSGGDKDSPAAVADTLNGENVVALAPTNTTPANPISLQQDTVRDAADTGIKLINDSVLIPPPLTTGITDLPSSNQNGQNGTSNGAAIDYGSLNNSNGSTSGSGNGEMAGPSAAELVAQNNRERAIARAQAAREAESTRAIEYAQWLAAQQSKLRTPTRISLGGSDATATGPGTERVGESRFGTTGTEADSNGDDAGAGSGVETDEVGASQIINGVSIPPGARVRAITMTEYRSDLEGEQTVQIQLQEPLRVGGRTVLPAGTLGYGKVTATPGGAGRSAYVQMNISTFQTRQGQIIRNVTAQAGDPETYAMAIKGRTDNRLGERIARGLAATVMDIGFAAGSQRLANKITGENQSSGLMLDLSPSPTDVALLRAQERAQPIINAAVGDENSIQPAVILKKGTPFVLFFGF